MPTLCRPVPPNRKAEIAIGEEATELLQLLYRRTSIPYGEFTSQDRTRALAELPRAGLRTGDHLDIIHQALLPGEDRRSVNVMMKKLLILTIIILMLAIAGILTIPVWAH